MERSAWSIGWLVVGAVLVAAAGAVACGPRLSSGTSAVLSQLGKAEGFGGADCSSAEAIIDAYLEEIGRRPSEGLNVTVPRFAKRAAGVCPQSHPVIRVSTRLESSTVRRILGVTALAQDAPIQLESWLRADVEHGKVVSLSLDLGKMAQ